MNPTAPHGLYQLARLYDVQSAYYDVFGKRRQAPAASLIAILQALGAPLAGMGEVQDALRERKQFLWQSCLEPVLTVWKGGPLRFEFRVPAAWNQNTLSVRLRMETGEVQKWEGRLHHKPTVKRAIVEGSDYLVKKLSLPGKLPWGYHELSIQTGAKSFKALVISAPEQAYGNGQNHGAKNWGLFLPLYALHSHQSRGGGNFTDLRELVSWVKDLGGGVIGTLPILSAFLDQPFEISPYSPASRLLWNEFYLDLSQVQELEQCSAAQALLASAEFQRQNESLRMSPTVDYRAQMNLQRRVIEEAVGVFFNGHSDRWSRFQRFLRANPRVQDYASFRAVVERQGCTWRQWPEELRRGRIQAHDYDEKALRYHLYVQWLADEQLGALARETNSSGTGLYLDLPLGVHPDGYDVWREQELFVQDVSGGAPPDSVFIGGQDWGFSPLHPERIRQEGYGYMIAVLRHHLKYASFLRIDHVMGLHRLFWIPHGFGAHEGAYVRNRYEEFYAILSVESHRHHAVITGENLGTVPGYVNAAMTRHGIQKMYVVQYEIKPNLSRALPPVPRHSVASMNTHDMRPFAAYWEGLDILDMVSIGLIDERRAEKLMKQRQRHKRALMRFLRRRGWLKNAVQDVGEVLKACLAYLGSSNAHVVLLNLEDLWLEKEPQNLPSTGEEKANWRRKARYGLEEFRRMPEILDVLQDMADLRNGAKQKG